ncbi:unnamed protein product [Haemonchus placei]|uniref:Ovule protein n=1 Tax=Haemonchus placei TaxID=6290 RepID=A0A0N4VYC6_HAEPC|nr:unnamed protein product [Haemonchus placei]
MLYRLLLPIAELHDTFSKHEMVEYRLQVSLENAQIEIEDIRSRLEKEVNMSKSLHDDLGLSRKLVSSILFSQKSAFSGLRDDIHVSSTKTFHRNTTKRPYTHDDLSRSFMILPSEGSSSRLIIYFRV